MRRGRPAGIVVSVFLVGVWGTAIAPHRALAQPLTFTHVGTIPGPVQLIEVRGAYAYVAADKTLTVFDVSDPASPTRVGAYAFPQRINGFRSVGTLIYVAADAFGLGIIDVSNRSDPTLIGSLETPGQAKNVSVSGTRALVADVLSGLDIVDVSHPTNPLLVGSVFLEGLATDVVTSGSLAYAADRPTGFYVVDLSQDGDSEPVSPLQSTIVVGRFAQLEILEPSPGGPRTAILVAGGVLQLFDVSDPEAPVALSPYRTPGVALRVSLKGHLAYVAAGREGLQIVDLSTPSNPRIVGEYETPRPAMNVSVAESLVFVVVFGGDVIILQETSGRG